MMPPKLALFWSQCVNRHTNITQQKPLRTYESCLQQTHTALPHKRAEVKGGVQWGCSVGGSAVKQRLGEASGILYTESNKRSEM